MLQPLQYAVIANRAGGKLTTVPANVNAPRNLSSQGLLDTIEPIADRMMFTTSVLEHIKSNLLYFQDPKRILSGIRTIDARRLGGVSVHGFAICVNYTDNMLKLPSGANAVFPLALKFVRRTDADLLAKEFIVGRLCVNELNRFYPVFALTYAMYKIRDVSSFITLRDHFLTFTTEKKEQEKQQERQIHDAQLLAQEPDKKVKQNPPNQLLDVFADTDDDLTEIVKDAISRNSITDQYVKRNCRDPLAMCLVSQFIPNSGSLDDVLTKMQTTSRYKTTDQDIIELFSLQTLILYVLNNLRDVYRHSDLHLNNILCYPVPDKKHVKWLLHDGKKDINLYTKYIPIIIDQGVASVKYGNINTDAYAAMSRKYVECTYNYPWRQWEVPRLRGVQGSVFDLPDDHECDAYRVAQIIRGIYAKMDSGYKKLPQISGLSNVGNLLEFKDIPKVTSAVYDFMSEISVGIAKTQTRDQHIPYILSQNKLYGMFTLFPYSDKKPYEFIKY